MSMSECLRAEDWRAIVRVVGECRELGDDARLWRRHCFVSLAGLTGGDLVLGGELVGLKCGAPRDLGTAEWGWENGFDRRGWLRALELLQSEPGYSTVLVEYGRRAARDEGVALRRTELADERAWRRSTECQEVFRTTGIDHGLYCFGSVPGTDDEVSGSFILRAAGRPDFNGREAAIFETASSLIAPLIGGALARFSEPSPTDLPPRVRQVLRCLLEGDGDKQIAARLRISVYTVNQYTKVLHRHFGTQGRAELMARWIRRGWGARCAWAD